MIDTQHIRLLDFQDRKQVQQMQTGIKDDYIIRIFDKLISSNEHKLFGLFNNDQLVSIAGYTIFAKQYAMIGRLRSDERFKGNGYATKLNSFIVEQLKKDPNIKWIGANTQKHNTPALRVLNNIDLPQIKTLHASTVIKPELLQDNFSKLWTPVTTLEEKREWISTFKHDSNTIFPYECYYPFPSSEKLFEDVNLENWLFYKNSRGDRFVIIKLDQKKHLYAHVVYLWEDIFEQPGLWNTILHAQKQFENNPYIWVDLTDRSRKQANEKAFEFQDPWILHGFWLDS